MASSVHPMFDNSHLQKKTRSVSSAAFSAVNQNDKFNSFYSANGNFLYDVFMWLIDNVSGEWSTGPFEDDPGDQFVTCRVKFKEQKDLDAFVTWMTQSNPAAALNLQSTR